MSQMILHLKGEWHHGRFSSESAMLVEAVASWDVDSVVGERPVAVMRDVEVVMGVADELGSAEAWRQDRDAATARVLRRRILIVVNKLSCVDEVSVV